MALLVPDAGERKLLDATIAGDEDLVLDLFTNDKTPAEGDIASDYTIAIGGGYVQKALAKATWAVAATNTGVTSKQYPQQTFTFTGALTAGASIYGYIIRGSVDGVIRWVERITPPFTPANNGDTYAVTPRIEAA